MDVTVPPSSNGLASFIQEELDAAACPVCYSTMSGTQTQSDKDQLNELDGESKSQSSQRSQAPLNPILLFPCGHTICSDCIEQNIKLFKNVCPICRQSIQSRAINFSLQQIISSLVKNKNKQNANSPNPNGLNVGMGVVNGSVNVDEYLTQYQMYSVRCAIWEKKIFDLTNNIQKMDSEVSSSRLIMSHFDSESSKILAEIARLQNSLALIKEHLTKHQQKVITLETDLTQNNKELDEMKSTLNNLTLMRDKSFFILAKCAPHLLQSNNNR